MSIWKNKSSNMIMPWGKITSFSSPFGMAGKIIHLASDRRTSLKYYTRASQCLFLLKGKVSIYAPDEKEFGDIFTENGNYFELVPGDTILIQNESPYRIKAIEDSILIETLGGGVNSYEYIRLEDDYGRTE
jgi:5-deoxy-D-glucuronate isomerase